MPLYVGLHIVTLVMCVVTLTLAVAALMPQLKLGLMLLRDGLLWALLLVIIAFVGFVGWGRLFELRNPDMSQRPDTSLGEVFDFGLTSEPELDPLPLPSAQDEVREVRMQQPIETIPVVQVSEFIPRMKVTSTSDFSANRSQTYTRSTPRRRVSSTSGLKR